MKRKRVNWRIVSSNLAEALEQLEATLASINSGKRPDEMDLQIQLEHVYHHLNYAWNARHASEARNRDLSTADFNRWSRFPRRIQALRLAPAKRHGRRRH